MFVDTSLKSQYNAGASPLDVLFTVVLVHLKTVERGSLLSQTAMRQVHPTSSTGCIMPLDAATQFSQATTLRIRFVVFFISSIVFIIQTTYNKTTKINIEEQRTIV